MAVSEWKEPNPVAPLRPEEFQRICELAKRTFGSTCGAERKSWSRRVSGAWCSAAVCDPSTSIIGT